MSPESIPTSSIRKSNNHIRSPSNKEDQNTALENGRMNVTTSTSVNSTVSSSQQKQQCQSEHINQPHVNETTLGRAQSLGGGGGGGGGGGNGDVLLQWGQRKRSRCSRSEGRSMLEKSQMTNHIMPPVHPSTSSNSNNSGCRNGGGGVGVSRVRPNGLLLGKNGSGFSPSKNRNLGDQMGCSSSASPLRNGGAASGTRAISRSSVGKRSPSRIDKNDKKNSSSGSIRKVKSDDPLPVPGNGNHTESAHGEQDNGGVIATMACSLLEADKGTNNEVVEWPRIYLSLSRKEKEDDFYAMKGTKLPHRPKKRAKAVDRALQYCFPGLWLSDLTRARYEVRERKSTKKPKRRGLKGLENMESESE